MTEKCWFILKQNHYPPPVIPEVGFGKVKDGPICLGHLIPNIKHLDHIINTNGPLEIPPSARIYPSGSEQLKFGVQQSAGKSISGKSRTPVHASPGVALVADAQAAFQQTIKNFWEFEKVDTFIFQPTSAYIEDSLEDEDVMKYITRQRSVKPTLFMITGIKVGRGVKRDGYDSQRRDIHGNLAVRLPEIVNVRAKVRIPNETEVSSTTQSSTDFVWAIRLMKITRGFIDRQWSFDTFHKGATFGVGEDIDRGPEIIAALQEEGTEIEHHSFDSEGDVFLVNYGD